MGRRSKAVKLVGGVRGGLALLDDDERRRVIEAGERDIDDGVGFFFSRHGSAWHGVDGRVRRRVQGPFQGRDRPRPGDERGAGTGKPRRAPRRDARHRQIGEGRPTAGPASRNAGSRRGAEPATPVLGLQDTGTDRNRVLREPSGASCLTIRAEQKTGHINVPDGTFAPPLVRLCGPVVSACRRTAPGRSRRRTRGSQPDARPSATASGRSSPG